MTTLTPLQIATRRHAAADMLKAQTYGITDSGEYRGCSIGCLAHDLEPDWECDDIASRGHARVADEYYDGQEWLARLQDRIFEGLPAEQRAWWHTDLADAVAARKRDWAVIKHAILAAILRMVMPISGSSSDAVQRVIDLHERAMRGEDVPQDEWEAAARAEEAARDEAYHRMAEIVLSEITVEGEG